MNLWSGGWIFDASNIDAGYGSLTMRHTINCLYNPHLQPGTNAHTVSRKPTKMLQGDFIELKEQWNASMLISRECKLPWQIIWRRLFLRNGRANDSSFGATIKRLSQSLCFADRQKYKYSSTCSIFANWNGFGTSDNSVENFGKQSLLDYSSDIRASLTVKTVLFASKAITLWDYRDWRKTDWLLSRVCAETSQKKRSSAIRLTIPVPRICLCLNDFHSVSTSDSTWSRAV